MGFRTGAYAKVWEVTPRSDTATKLNISTSRKNKQTGEYERDFSGFPMCVGTAAAAKAAKLKSGDTIILGDVDVTTPPKQDGKGYFTNYTIFSFEVADNNRDKPAAPKAAKPAKKSVDYGDPDPAEDSRLPF